jgi:orotate phosphoribosyltransferase
VFPARVYLLVEDLITDAGSKLNFIDAIRQAGGRVTDVAVVFDRQQGGEKVLEERGVRLHTLTTLAISLDVAREKGLITVEELDVVHKYLDSARDWHAERGLVFNG